MENEIYTKREEAKAGLVNYLVGIFSNYFEKYKEYPAEEKGIEFIGMHRDLEDQINKLDLTRAEVETIFKKALETVKKGKMNSEN